MFKRRDPEGKFIINNVLLNGHVHMLEYLLDQWLDTHANLPLVMEGNTSVLHQAMCKAAFLGQNRVKQNGEKTQHVDTEQSANEASPSRKEPQSPSITGSASKKKEAPELTEETFIKMIRLLLSKKDALIGTEVYIDKQDRLGRTVLHLAAQHGMT